MFLFIRQKEIKADTTLVSGRFKDAEKQGQDPKSSFNRQVASNVAHHFEKVEENFLKNMNLDVSLCKI